MIIPIELRFKADKDSKSALRTDKTIKSHDVNSIEFHISIDGLELSDTHTAKILSIFHSSKSQVNMDCEIVDGKIIYKPDTNLISRHEHVTNYVYVYKGNQSLDVCEFIYIVDLSKIDETSLEVKEVYDQSYADLLSDFEQALSDYKDSLPQADSVRADIDEILNQFSVDSQAKLSQYDTDAQQVITDNQTAFDLAESVRQATYEQAEDSRRQASEQAVGDFVQTANAQKDAKLSEIQADADSAINQFKQDGNSEIVDWRVSADIELAEKVQNFKIESLWGSYGSFDIPITGMVAIYAKNDNSLNVGTANLKSFNLVSGHKYYVKIELHEDTQVNIDRIALGNSFVSGLNSKKISVVGTISRTGSNFLYTQPVYGQTGILKYKSGLAVNLTTTFGAGNEPTKLEMDELIKVIPNQWWDGELTLTQKQFITWQLNLIRKNTNALIALGGTII